MVLLAVGAGLAFVSITVAAVSEANEADAGLASGMVTTAQQVGGALGLAVLVSIATTRASNLLSSGHSVRHGPAQRKPPGVRGRAAGILAIGAVMAAALIGRYKPTTLPARIPITQMNDEAEPETLVAWGKHP